MQTLKMLTAAITFASLGVAGTAFAETSETTQSTGQGSAADVSTTQTNDKNSRSEAVDTAKPDYARDTHTSAYKKTYPDEAPVMGEELSPDQQNELTPSDKNWEEGDKKQ